MGSWGITERESDYGLDLLGTIAATKLKTADFATFNVAEAIDVITAEIMEEIRKANRGCSAETLVFYFGISFPQNFTHGALLIAECLADYYRTGELIVTEYVGENYDPVDHHIKEIAVTNAELEILLGELRKVQDPEHELYQSWFEDSDREKMAGAYPVRPAELREKLIAGEGDETMNSGLWLRCTQIKTHNKKYSYAGLEQ